MYEAFYGFTEKPFSLLPDPAFLYLGRKHRMALTMLQYGMMNNAGFTVITGEIGSGKTTLIRQLLDEIEEDVTVGLITNTHESFGDLLQWVLMAYGIEYKGMEKVELYEAFVRFVVGEYADNRRTVLIIDEAQNLTPKTLEELRMLSNINADKNQVLQMIMVGQPELRSMLMLPSLKQFAQRVSVSHHLDALNSEETVKYIHHRISVAGGDPAIFPAKSCSLIWYYSRGVPRVINSLCDTALVYGFAEQAREIQPELIKDVVKDRKAGGLFAGRDDEAPQQTGTGEPQ
ncbi:MAG: AAA family ATPase [Gammaproteobacteria bacterium]|nr:AAA family ATPase [Gammaproteobacteria bacterium]NNF62547.1 AAA family ATPase [Gammaproteobacteria bacterium]NNM20750.1 AAA family ATPase [Gammaproteobacteria bacterium]